MMVGGKRISLRSLALYWCLPSSVLSLFLVVMIFEGASIFGNDPDVDGRNTIYYEASQENFANPERGWFRSIEPIYYKNQTAPPLTVEQLEKLRREDGITVIRKYYVITDYRERDIPDSYLQGQLANDFAVAREAGFKLIPRFTYVFNPEFGKEDATLSQTLRHIEQIRPILRANGDVLAYLQAGFVGFWGEWHSSSNEHVEPGSKDLDRSGDRIMDALLDATPPDRMVAFRYPQFLLQRYGDEPISAAEAYTATEKARTGLHNDGVAYNATDFGTFDSRPEVQEREREYWRQTSEYSITSGEPGGDTRRARERLLYELERFRYTSLNMNQHDPATDGLYEYLKEEGLHDVIARKLGYRFRLLQATVPESAVRGGSLTLTMEMRNDGFARPYNPRLVEVVLRHQTTGREYNIPVGMREDPRLWLPGSDETETLEATVDLPADLAAGEYDVLLSLPDPEPELYGHPEYSIRLANKDVWEEDTGYNALQTSVRITG